MLAYVFLCQNYRSYNLLFAYLAWNDCHNDGKLKIHDQNDGYNVRTRFKMFKYINNVSSQSVNLAANKCKGHAHDGTTRHETRLKRSRDREVASHLSEFSSHVIKSSRCVFSFLTSCAAQFVSAPWAKLFSGCDFVLMLFKYTSRNSY